MNPFFSCRCFSFRLLYSILILFLSSKGGLFAAKYFVPKILPNTHYDIKVNIDVDNKNIVGEEIVSFINTSKKELSLLAFNWSLSKNSTIEIRVNGDNLSLINSGKGINVAAPLLYSLNSPLKPGEQVRLEIEFTCRDKIRNSDDIKIVDWYPRLWWDGIDTYDSYKIKLDIPDDFVFAISGRLNKETGYYENNGVRSCGIYLGKGLKSEQKEIEDVLITSLFSEEGDQCARLCLETAVDVVKFYKDWLGFYPFKFLYIIPGATEPWGGYPFASGIVVIHGQEQFDKKSLLHWKWITAHEIGHQFWGEYIFDDEDSWLWIGLGVYADREYAIHRNLGLKKHTDMMNRYIEGVKKHYNTTADLTRSQIQKVDFDYNNVVKHGKGFSIISALECILGKDTFIQVYKRCLDEYAGKYLSYRDVWKICEVESGENLAWFFEQWVRSNKYLSYNIISQKSGQQKDGFISQIEIKCNGTLKMPIPVKAIFEDGSSQLKFTDRLLGINNLIFKSKSKLEGVALDPDKKLAMIGDSLFVSQEEMIENISQLSWQGVQQEAIHLFSKAKKIDLKDQWSWYKLGLVLFDSRNDQEVLYSFQKAHELDPDHFVTLVWLGHMNDLKGNREEAIKYYHEALEHDTGGTIQHDQFGLKINRKWVEERLQTPFSFKKE